MTESRFSQERPLVVAHRGASAREAENTIDAFEAAIAAGADSVELDVRLTADGEVVVLHDPDVSRTTDGRGWVQDLTLAQVKGLRIRTSHGDAAEVPTLAEALRCCLGRVAVDIELKNIPGEPDFEPDDQSVADATIEVVRGMHAGEHVLLSSFNPMALARVQGSAAELPTGLLTEPAVDAYAALSFARQGGYRWILPSIEAVARAGQELVSAAHDAGIRVGTWITDDPAEAVGLFRTGIDAVATNDPGVVVPAVREAFGP